LAISLAIGAAAACGGGNQAVVVRQQTSAASSAAPAAKTPPTSAPTPIVAPPAALDPAAPGKNPVAVVPTSAAIEVHDAPGAGWHGVATVVGPGGSRSAPLDGGSATFNDLDEGVYDVTVSRESDPAAPSDDGTQIGTSVQTLNAGRYGLTAGDRAVVTCDETSCTGVL
jgi:hypothetical protein